MWNRDKIKISMTNVSFQVFVSSIVANYTRAQGTSNLAARSLMIQSEDKIEKWTWILRGNKDTIEESKFILACWLILNALHFALNMSLQTEKGISFRHD